MDGRGNGVARCQAQKPLPLRQRQRYRIQAVEEIRISVQVELMKPIITERREVHRGNYNAGGSGESSTDFTTCILLLPPRLEQKLDLIEGAGDGATLGILQLLWRLDETIPQGVI